MILLSLKTQCFKKLGDFSADFTHGLNAIVGDNAMGKSTILQAIGFALYGNDAVPVKEADICTWGETRGYKVTLKFAHDGVTYEATRSKSTARISRLTEDGPQIVANGKSDSVRFITDLLGLNWKEFKLFVVSTQSNTTAAIKEGATALNRKVEERSGIDLIDRVQSLSRKRANDCELKAARLEHSCESLEEFKGMVARAEESYAELGKQLAELVKPTEPEVTLPEVPTMPTALVQLRADYNAATVKVSNCQATLANAEDELKQAQVEVDSAGEVAGVSHIEAAYEEATQKLHALRKDYNAELRNRDAHEAAVREVSVLERNILALLNDGDESERLAEIEGLKDHESELRGSRLALEVSRAEAAHEVSSLQSMLHNAVCPTCKQKVADVDVEDVEKKIEQTQTQLSVINASHAEAVRREGELAAEITAKTEAYNNLCSMQDKHTAKSEQVESLSGAAENAEAIEAQIGALEQSVDNYRSQIALAEEAARRKDAAIRNYANRKLIADNAKVSLDQAIEALSKLRVVTDADIQAATDEWEAFNTRRAEVQALKDEYNEKLREYEKSYATVESMHRRCGHDLDSYKRCYEEAEREVAQYTAVRKEAERCKRLGKFLSDNREKYLRAVWGQVLAVASAYVREATKGSITEIEFNDGVFKFNENGMVADVAAASGAQSAFIGIAVRIGLSRVLYGDSGLLIFDEPTESMTEENAASSVATLSTAADQVLVITHKESDQELARNVITRY